jgi:hypothetical protein
MQESFDYKGYSAGKLERLCSEDNAFTGLSPWRYWTSEIYSFGRHIRNYGFYPSMLPIYCYASHGVDVCTSPIYPHELNNDAYAMFISFPERTEEYSKVSSKPCYCILAPHIWYRRKNKIHQVDKPLGTLVFPAHTTKVIDLFLDMELYIEELKKLPEKFHPICISLHMHDIHKGQHHLFMEHGFPIYTAGAAEDVRFSKRWYDIARNFKYMTSNLLGSYTFYSVEMGTPFFLYGTDLGFVNHADLNMPLGVMKQSYNMTPEITHLYALFSALGALITDEQQAVVENYLGVHHSISRWEMAKVLYTAFLKQGNLFKDLWGSAKHVMHYLFRKSRRNRRRLQRYCTDVMKALCLSLRLCSLRVPCAFPCIYAVCVFLSGKPFAWFFKKAKREHQPACWASGSF